MADIVDDPPTPERRLFQSIIYNAIMDAVYGPANSKPRQREMIRMDALRWFATAGADFQLICESADLDPSLVQDRALDYIRLARDSGIRRVRRGI